MADFATVSDIEAAWRPLSGQEQVTATARLSQASAIIRRAVPGIEARMATEVDLFVVATGVAVDMVLRVLKNPDGKRQAAIDDYSWTLDSTRSTGDLYLSPTELASLLPVTHLGGAYVVSLAGD